MKAAAWMVAGCVGTWLVAAVVLERAAAVDALLGMLGPLVVVAGTWLLVERAHERDPQQVTAVMMRAFAGKMLFFGAYVAVVLGALGRQPVPFVVSFTAYFIALYAYEALLLRRLMTRTG